MSRTQFEHKKNPELYKDEDKDDDEVAPEASRLSGGSRRGSQSSGRESPVGRVSKSPNAEILAVVEGEEVRPRSRPPPPPPPN